jgi:hypothetical protein
MRVFRRSCAKLVAEPPGVAVFRPGARDDVTKLAVNGRFSSLGTARQRLGELPTGDGF